MDTDRDGDENRLRAGGAPLNRRAFIGAAAGAMAAAGPLRAFGAAPFGFDAVIDAAMTLARSDYARPTQTLRAPFADLDYDRYRAIRFKAERRLWLGEGRGFTAELAAPGFLFRDPVAIALIDDATERPLPFDAGVFNFDPAMFDAASFSSAQASEGHAWSGLRLRYPIDTPEVMDEVAVFQGASYFRAIARGLSYGLSARGLAIGTGSPRPEEFPAFTRLWLQTPEPGAAEITLLALLDSPSVAGAYAFTIRPGLETVMDVRAVLAPRRDVEDAGIAPLTSMYWFSALDRRAVDDHRSAVHDSDGLAMLTGLGERVWRPINNPSALQVSAFADDNPRAFGLAQRQRAFGAYNDAEARYERRPSAWVEPVGDWGPGAVTLVEIPTNSEFNDNIVAFWRPGAPLTAGTAHRFTYRLTWSASPPDGAGLAQVVATRVGRAVNNPQGRTFAIDLDLRGIAAEGLTVEAGADRGVIDDARPVALPVAGLLRVAIQFTPPAEDAAELRMRLVGPDGAAASETWLHRWTRR